MKRLKIVFSISFFVLLLIPVAAFNWKDNVVSKIDNRQLADNPFGMGYDKNRGWRNLAHEIENYIEDRIGFRDTMIYSYTMLNDNVFREMVHPNYAYGKEGYVFRKAQPNPYFEQFHIAFADMVKQLQDYCEERNVPFLFVINPEKEAIMKDKLAPGIHYNDSWLRQLKTELGKRRVKYIENYGILKEKSDQGELVFNKKYDAAHWNDLGAFYGVNHILETMKREFPNIHINKKTEFDIQQELNRTLPVSEFPIHEYVPVFSNQSELTDKTLKYDKEVKRDENFPFFEYVINEKRKKEGSPKVMVFQGSYMNAMGYKFMENSFGEYITVHNYQNIIEFPYYFNIFKPQYVLFEAAQFTIKDEYFNYANMLEMNLFPDLDAFKKLPVKEAELSQLSLEISHGEELITITTYHFPEDTLYAYLRSGGEVFDFEKKTSESQIWYEATIDKEKYEPENISVEIVDKEKKELIKYR